MKSFKEIVRKTLKESTADKNDKPKLTFEKVISKHEYKHSKLDSAPGYGNGYRKHDENGVISHIVNHFFKEPDNFCTSGPFKGITKLKKCHTPEELDKHLTDLHK